ncbi:MAG TPA: hypothetical protein VN622_12915 [Clostridia bacterium]|nr:hypothetical protein [Clostridia bacterium]
MSSDFVPFPPQTPQEGLAMVGFRVDANAEGPQIYTLIAYGGENDRPLLKNGRVLFFRSAKQAQRALELADNNMKALGPAPAEIEMLCDIAEALHVVNAMDLDEDGVILDVIGCFDDLVRAAQVNVPAEYMAVLSALSEQLLQGKEFGSFLQERGIDREKAEDAIMWCVGAIVVKGTVL